MLNLKLWRFESPVEMIIGQKGIKYGLQQVNARRQAAPVQPKLSVFGDQSDGEDDVGAQVARHAASKATDSKVRIGSVRDSCHTPPSPPARLHLPCHTGTTPIAMSVNR